MVADLIQCLQWCGSGAVSLPLPLPLPGKSEDCFRFRFRFRFRFHASRQLPKIFNEVKHYGLKFFRWESTNVIFKTAFQIQPKNIFSHNLKGNHLHFSGDSLKILSWKRKQEAEAEAVALNCFRFQPKRPKSVLPLLLLLPHHCWNLASRTPSKIGDISRILAEVDDDFDVSDWVYCPWWHFAWSAHALQKLCLKFEGIKTPLKNQWHF